MSTRESILADLNPPQREAVETLNGPLLILAGAGSGKTRVVTRRIANLIAHDVRPWQILAITFTNKAAGEMKRRVEELAGESGAWLSTFHSFCARLLRRESEVLGYSRDFTIFDEEDSTSLLKDITKRMGLSEDKRFSPRNVRQMISKVKNQALTPDDLNDSSYHERLIKEIFTEYDTELKKNQAFDFDDLLRQTVLLFRDHPEVLARYQERFRYVLVDEYQDTNASQYHLIKMLGQKHRNVCATGDPDQSIYAWRGADVRNILSFEKDFPEAKVVKLEQNYRSTSLILAAASSVIVNNTERKHKDLWTERKGGEQLSYIVAGDEMLEAYEIARKIGEHTRDTNFRAYSDMAVFYRTNAQSRAIETALIQAAIPYQLIGGTAFYERREVKDALSYLRLVINPRDDVAFRRVLNVPRRGLGPSALEAIEKKAAECGKSMLELFDGDEGQVLLDSFGAKARSGMVQFLRLIDTLRAMPMYPVLNVVRAALEKSGLLAALLDAGEQERVDNLNELLNAAGEYDKENDPAKIQAPSGPPPEPGAFDGLEEMALRQASLSGFLENSALLAATDQFDSGLDRVTLMTLHMAKGLEFPIVFLAGLEEGLLPMQRGGFSPDGEKAPEDERAIEEERRLLYVGITRAMEKLYILRAKYRRRFGKADISSPSRFLNEIPEKLLNLEDRSIAAWSESLSSAKRATKKRDDFDFADDTEKDPAFAAFEREVADFEEEPVMQPKISSRRFDPALESVINRLSDVSEDAREFEIGDRVRHAKYGVGTVENVSGSGIMAKVKVIFKDHGPKLLIASMAKLEKL